MKQLIEKIDGSLISFFKVGDKLELKTMKSMESDVANLAREYALNRADIKDLAIQHLDRGLSPIFEFTSKESRIVLDYGDTNMSYLGCRNMTTGEIMSPKDGLCWENISVAKCITDIDSYMKREDVD